MIFALSHLKGINQEMEKTDIHLFLFDFTFTGGRMKRNSIVSKNRMEKWK